MTHEVSDARLHPNVWPQGGHDMGGRALERDQETRALRPCFRHGEGAAQILDDVVGKREAEAEAGADRLGREERIEDPLQMRAVDAGAAILDPELDAAATPPRTPRR